MTPGFTKRRPPGKLTRYGFIHPDRGSLERSRPGVDRNLLLAILKHVILVVEAGRSPEQIAALKL